MPFKTLIKLLILAILLPLPADAATPSFLFLQKQGGTVRHSLGGIDLLSPDYHAVLDNFSSIIQGKSPGGFSVSFGSDNLSTRHLDIFGAVPAGPVYLGWKLMWLGSPPLDAYLDHPPRRATDELSCHAAAAGIAISWSLAGNEKRKRIISMSAGLDGAWEKTGEDTAFAMTFNTGFSIPLVPDRLIMALVFRDFGLRRSSLVLPLKFQSGLKLLPLTDGRAVTTAIGLSWSAEAGGLHSILMSLESGIRETVYLRCGTRFYFQEHASYAGTFNFGIGLRYGRYRLDSSMRPAYRLRSEYLGSLGLDFRKSKDKTRSTDRAAEARAVKRTVDKAKEALQQKNPRKAMKVVKEALKEYPDNPDLKDMLTILKSRDIELIKDEDEK